MTTTVRPARLADAEALPSIERSAAELFRQVPELAWLADEPVPDAAQHAHNIACAAVWVAMADEDTVAGFLSAEIFDHELHIQELSVSRRFQGLGLGRQLLQAALASACHSGLAAMTLTTFRELPWNEAFYQRFGFETLAAEQIGPRLTAVLHDEATHGLPPSRRCAMRYVIRPAIMPG
ncbi:GNAT family N-acetyltransferase [Pseudomonas purpurea]|uniref:GNAT family N-acetyltransferase n=1 Tax=Pseudomonas purpurea TaxID=3136737 RepID=UPI003267F47D